MLARSHTRTAVLIFIAVLFGALPALAQSNDQTGKLKIHVHPKQAYVFVDGKAIRDGSQTIDLPAGAHEVGVYNYGYVPKVENVDISTDRTTKLDVALQASGDMVPGPFGDIEFKGHPRAAVLLNGTTPDYFVGHVDEFDWNWIWHQRLLVKPGTYQVMVTRRGNTIWSGPVSVRAGQQVTVYLNQSGKMKTRNWPEGNALGPQPRFHAGIASATVPVASPTARLNAQSTQLGCGQSAQLQWKSTDAVAISITNLGNVSASGDRSVMPTKTTTYELVAKGPGGEATQTATVDVNAQPTATLTLSQPEVRYHKIGDKVVQDDGATLQWSTSNANQVTITPLGSEAMSGSQTIEAKPAQTTPGRVDETVDYTLLASNACGGTATRTALLHIVGSIDPPPAIVLDSVFYPTNYPTRRNQKVGLVRSQQQALAQLATHFKNYEQYDGKADLLIVGHADVRGSQKYNLALSERRANLVKEFLVSHGIAPDKVAIRYMGKQEQLTEQHVKKLQMEDPQKPEKAMKRVSKVIWLAYNRRTDIVLQPAGQRSAVAYPNDASDARILWERTEPSLKAVETASRMPHGTEQARLGNPGN